MNDIQSLEKIYNTTTAVVNEQQESLSAASAQVVQAQKEYLQSVVHAATLSEKTRRKKEVLISSILCASGILVLIILFLNFMVGLFVIGAFGVIIMIVKQHDNDSMTKYNNRKLFFSKYEHVVPADEKLKW